MPRRRSLRRISDEDEFETAAFRMTQNAEKKSNKTRFSDSESNHDEELESGEDEESMKESCDKLYASSDNDDSDAPEDVTFATSKTAALQEIKQAMAHVNLERTKKREKRKKIDDKFREQKKRKLQALAECKLPDDILDAVPARPEKPINQGQERTPAPNDSDRGSMQDSDSEMEKFSEDFIPLSANRSTGIHAIPLKNEKLKCVTDSVAEFRHRALYNSKIRRESTKSMLSKKVKRRAQRMTRQ